MGKVIALSIGTTPTDEYAGHEILSTTATNVVRDLTATRFCHAQNTHTLMMDEYYSARDAWLQAREAVALGYATEEQQFAAENRRPLLRDFMINRERAS